MATAVKTVLHVPESGPAPDCFAITPSDSVPLSPRIRGIYVGTTGNITIQTSAGVNVLFVAVPAGKILPVQATYVMSTGTGAGSLVGLV